MKKLSLRKEILLVVAVLVVTFALSTSVFATSTTPVQIPVINANTTTDTTNTTTNTVENTTTNTPTVIPTTTNTATTNTSGSTYENTTLPQTGDASDYAIFAVIGLCVIIAIVAFRKARNYNI